MTFLELCEELTRESGAIGTAPAAVTGQTGRQEKCVQWIVQAWKQIQADQPEWSFLRNEFEGDLAINTTSYAASALGITDFSRWIGDRDDYAPVTIYVDGVQEEEIALCQIGYEAWRTSYNRGSHDAQKPTVFAIAPSQELCVGPKPDVAYKIRGEYQRSPQILAANDDVPIMPSQYHDAIVWRAAMMLAEHDEAPSAYTVAYRKYAAVLMNMERDLLPAITLGGNALA